MFITLAVLYSRGHLDDCFKVLVTNIGKKKKYRLRLCVDTTAFGCSSETAKAHRG
eukprot:TRINITY_DN10183_c0_g1_i1.p1 TRINITY_DN10183_c0_g1~~TRINITY_DN10183_c0_g1_i1.p1  ORF type:complete len:55 (+),score=20.10 TRINITY_DN10183_c0_g1_i1:266-430(+)